MSDFSIQNVQAKLSWCVQASEVWEPLFVDICKKNSIFKSIEINPEKVTNKYAPDLMIDGKVCELKSYFTPFFMSKKYGIDPQYAYTLGLKDIKRYTEKYPELDIYIFYNPQILQKYNISLNYIGGIYKLSLPEILPMCNEKNLHYHRYRQNDTSGNDKGNYVLDIRSFKLLHTFEKKIKIAGYND